MMRNCFYTAASAKLDRCHFKWKCSMNADCWLIVAESCWWLLIWAEAEQLLFDENRQIKAEGSKCVEKAERNTTKNLELADNGPKGAWKSWNLNKSSWLKVQKAETGRKKLKVARTTLIEKKKNSERLVKQLKLKDEGQKEHRKAETCWKKVRRKQNKTAKISRKVYKKLKLAEN